MSGGLKTGNVICPAVTYKSVSPAHNNWAMHAREEKAELTCWC